MQDTEVPETVLQDTGVSETILPDTVLPDTVLPDTVLQDTVLQDTNINSSTSNSFTITSLNNNSVVIDRLITHVKNLIDYQIMSFAYGGTSVELKALDDLVLVVAETLASPLPRITIAGQPLLADHVRDVLLTINNDASCHVLERFLARLDKINPQNHKNYLLTSIYQELNCPTPEDDGWEEQPYSVPK